ncbi:MAG: hypothetical protein KJ630_11025 [Proteobacteria bacterium]|nr:hypothetical protein [Pseudomonadota bacterium]
MVEEWTNLIYKVATGSWKARIVIAPIVGASYIGFIVVFVLLSLTVDQWLNLPKAFSHPVSLIGGFTLILCGFLLTCLSIAHFLRVRGTPVPFSPPPILVVAGPYRFTRNPMLTGIFIQLFGIATVYGSLSLLFIFTPLFIIINVWDLHSTKSSLGDVRMMNTSPCLLLQRPILVFAFLDAATVRQRSMLH